MHAEELSAPLQFIDQLYELRIHIHLMRRRFVATLWQTEKAEGTMAAGEI